MVEAKLIKSLGTLPFQLCLGPFGQRSSMAAFPALAGFNLGIGDGRGYGYLAYLGEGLCACLVAARALCGFDR